ncbi:MAG: alpha/beta fold hydrolase, partial [Dehalococcoidia bacterium]
MDAPPIQYARTSDGVNIAYWIMGHGEPLIHDMLPAASHLELEWKLTSLRSWYERLFERFTVVRFDHRGRGLSDRDLSDLSLDAHMRDVDAVADAARLDTFVLLGTRHMGPVSIAYSVANPGRVSHLALLNTWASGAKPSVLTALEASRSLSKLDHGIWAENIARFVAGRRDPDPALLDLFQG